MIQNTQVNQLQNGFRRTKYTFWSGQVKVQTWTPLRCCGMTSRQRFMPDIPGIWLNYSSFVKKNGPRLVLNDVPDWSAATGSVWLKLLLPKGRPQNIKCDGSVTYSSPFCHCLHAILIKIWKPINVWVVLVKADTVFSSVWFWQRSDHIWWWFYAEMWEIPKGSDTFSYHCMCFFLITVGECNHPIHQPTQNESEYQQKNIAGDLGNFLGITTHTISCVARSTNAQSLQVVPRCKGD